MTYHCWHWPRSPGWAVFARLLHHKVMPTALCCALSKEVTVLNTLIEWGATHGCSFSTTFCCSGCFSFGHWEFFQFTPLIFAHAVVIWDLCLFIFILVLNMSSLSDPTQCSRFILNISCPCPGAGCHFLKESWLFICKMVLETKVWALDVLIADGMLLLPSLLSWRITEVDVCAPAHVLCAL